MTKGIRKMQEIVEEEREYFGWHVRQQDIDLFEQEFGRWSARCDARMDDNNDKFENKEDGDDNI